MKKQVIAVGSRFTRLVDGFPVQFEVLKINKKMVVEFTCNGKNIKDPEQSREMHVSYFAKVLDMPKTRNNACKHKK